METRWNSTFYMLERIVEQEEAVRTALHLLNRNDVTISSEEVEVIKGIIEVLQPFEAVTREILSKSYISGSKIIPLARALQRLTCSVKKLELQKLVTKNKQKNFKYGRQYVSCCSNTIGSQI